MRYSFRRDCPGPTSHRKCPDDPYLAGREVVGVGYEKEFLLSNKDPYHGARNHYFASVVQCGEVEATGHLFQ